MYESIFCFFSYLLTLYAPLNQVKINSKRPWLLSGCKVQDGQGIMLVSASFWLTYVLCCFPQRPHDCVVATYTVVLDEFTIVQVTGVGVNTEWGQVMASVSEENGEETPLQVLNCLFIKLILCILIITAFCVFVVSSADPLKYKYAGSSEWSCYVHWESRSIHSRACLHHPDHSVSMQFG